MQCHYLFAGRFLALVSLLIGLVAAVTAGSPELADLQRRWDETNFAQKGEQQDAAFEQLQADTEAYAAAHGQDAEAWIWSGIVKSSFAGAKGGLGALGLAKAARKDFERALELDPDAMQGSAYTSLGTLYCSVPGWPVGFGDDEKAEELLLAGLQANPDGIDSNFFYAEYLRKDKRYADARAYYLRAQQAPPRVDREIADRGRMAEITAALADIPQ